MNLSIMGECGVITAGKIIEMAKIALAMPQGCNDPFLSNISILELQTPYLRFMYILAKELKPQAIVECGVYMATCTGHMASASPDSTVIGVDRDFHKDAWKVRDRYPNIVFFVGDTEGMAWRISTFLHNERKKIGILFLDSAHDGFTPMREFIAYSPMFDEECVVVCDDILGDNLNTYDQILMQKFWKELPGEQIELHSLHPAYADVGTPGFGVSIIK